jgi:intraflagellar transport protein 140
MVAITDTTSIILSEALMQKGQCGALSVVQVSTMHLSIHLGVDDVWIENTRLLIRGLSVAESSFVVWDGKTARVCTINYQSHRSTMLDPFPCPSDTLVIADSKHLSEEVIFITDHNSVKVMSYAGVQKGSIPFTEMEGRPSHINLCGKFLSVVTTNFTVKIFDVSTPKSPKLVGSAGKFIDSSSDSGVKSTSSASSKLVIRCIRGNANGTKVALLTSRVEGSLKVLHPDSRLHIYDRQKGSVHVYDFTQQSRYPANAFWDSFDDRLICVEAVRMQTTTAAATAAGGPEGGKKREGGGDLNENLSPDGEKKLSPSGAAAVGAGAVEGENEFEIVLLFASSEYGILLQDSFPRHLTHGDLLGINVPLIYFRSPTQLIQSEGSAAAGGAGGGRNSIKIFTKTMRDFVGINQVDDTVKFALLEFSFNLTLGKLDEAYRAVKAIDSPFIWENMAQMCVKTKRLDVAEVCLGNMGHARGACALRESLDDPNNFHTPDVHVGILAIQLGLLDDAARLFRECHRYDLLNILYQAAGQWDKAIQLATQSDRLHLKTTHYHYANYLESVGDLNEAIFHYEQSETFRTEIPRMLYSVNQIEELEEYVQHSNDMTLLKWWAAYMESKERYDKARKYYSKAGDYLSLVRILCFQGEYKRAADIIQETRDSAASYHLARQLEGQGELQDAITYYAASGCYNHAIRLAKAYNMDAELMTFALKSTSSLMLDCAVHFENKGDYEKAVQLYHKGGDYLHALDLCFKGGQGDGSASSASQRSAMFDMVNVIASDLGATTSPQILARCAEFLVLHRQYEKAVELYIMAKKYPQAIEMCIQQKVNITEEMANILTPPVESGYDANERKEILGNLGRALKKQGSFLLASKKYTQAGDRIRAIKCLLRNGDTKAVIQFASISRNEEIYKLAANYLQQMDWRDSEIMKAIITFYSKAKAYEQLSGFYDNCAQVPSPSPHPSLLSFPHHSPLWQVEIDEYRDYEKAYRALKEAMKYLREAKGRHIEGLVSTLAMRL